MATQKNDVTKEQLIILMAKYIKECSKKLTEEKPSMEVDIEIHNWCSCGKERKWVNTEIYFNGTPYKFYDKEITDREFLVIVETALKESKVKGKIETNDWEEWNGWGSTPRKSFKSLRVFGKPCKEFVTLNRMLKKYTNKEIGELQVFYTSVCGKRSSWDANMSRAAYLDFSKKRCQKVIDFIRSTRTSKDCLTFKVTEKLSHGDDEDYRIAQYQESEWYGSLCNNLELEVKTPKGKEKGTCKAF